MLGIRSLAVHRASAVMLLRLDEEGPLLLLQLYCCAKGYGRQGAHLWLCRCSAPGRSGSTRRT